MRRTNGPLAQSQSNPRYFADADGRPVVLCGMHTWNNLQDMGPGDPPRPLDFALYLDLLAAQGHNVTRLWAWDMLSTWKEAERVRPFPWMRAGPGAAVDGLPRVDLDRHDEEYFERLRGRVVAAGRRGIYVSVMLFDSWAVQANSFAPWDWHLFAAANNVNGIDILGSGRDGVLRGWCTLDDPAVLRVQERYVRKVVETLAACDNALYEISNEAGAASHPWQEHLIGVIREAEARRGTRHPVGFTGGMGTLNRLTYASAADYVAPECNAADGEASGYRTGTFTWGSAPFDRADKVVVLDTDHLWGIGGDAAWAWKSFCRGYNLLYMDPCTDQPWWFYEHPWWKIPSDANLRCALGKIRAVSERLDLGTTVPHNELSTTTYCLATPGTEYLVYQPEAGRFSVDLAGGSWHAEWHWPDLASGRALPPLAHDSGWRTFEGRAGSVLLLHR